MFALLTHQNTSTEDKNNYLENAVEFQSNVDLSSGSVAVKIFKILKAHQES